MAPLDRKHVLVTPHPLALGHIRPMIAGAVRLVLERPNTVISIIVAPVMIENAMSDVAAQLQGASMEEARSRIRIVSPVSMEGISLDPQGIDTLIRLINEAYPTVYQTLLESKPIKCEATGKIFEAVPPPSLLIVDFFAYSSVVAARAATGNKVPIVMFVAATAAIITKAIGPEHLGGYGDFAARIDAEVANSGRPPTEVSEEIYYKVTGKVVNLTGVPPMYDYEYFPQVPPYTESPSELLKFVQSTLHQCDGVVITTFEKWENGGSFQVCKSWLASLGKDLYGIGPILPSDYGSGAVSSRGATDVEEFLQRKLEKYGKKSVLYISFGSMCWPCRPEYIDELINALVEKDFPFLLCTAAPFANVSEHSVRKVEVSGKGLIIKWTPQQYVLNHPAVGWFLSHGGHNSVVESLTSGIPMVLWPFSADQPITSVILEKEGASIELIEVRTGPHALKTIYRFGRAPKGTREAVGEEIRGVLDSLRGEKGAEMTHAAQRIQRMFTEAWEEGGEGKTAFHALLTKYLDGIGRNAV